MGRTLDRLLVLVQWATAITLFAVAATLGGKLSRNDIPTVELPRQVGPKLNAALLKTVSLGYLPAAVDLIWIRAVLDPSYQKLPRGTHPPAFYDYQLVTESDPYFLDVAFHGAEMLNVIWDDPEGAVQLLHPVEAYRQARYSLIPETVKNSYWHQAWRVPMLIGYLNLFELDSIPEAAKYYSLAAPLPGAPLYISKWLERLGRTEAYFEMGIKVLNLWLEDETKPELVRERLAEKRNRLVLHYQLYTWNRQFQKWLNGRKSTTDRFFAFRNYAGIPELDIFGGSIGLGQDGAIMTSTALRSAMGLNYLNQ